MFTNFPDLYDGCGNAWRLDDGDPTLAPVGDAFIASRGRARGPDHRRPQGPVDARSGYSSPLRVARPTSGRRPRAHPDGRFVAYHSGYEADVVEGPYDDATARRRASNRLVASMQRRGRSDRTQNVYAELGTTWWALLDRPDEAAHVLGKLLVHVGEDNVLWGTDAVFYGSPQGQIQAFRAFQISEQFQERVRLPRAHRRDQAQGARPQRVCDCTTSTR